MERKIRGRSGFYGRENQKKKGGRRERYEMGFFGLSGEGSFTGCFLRNSF